MEKQDCRHPQIDDTGRCHTCGTQFRPVWNEERRWLVMQTLRSVAALALISIGLGVLAAGSNSTMMGALTVAVVVFLGARLTYSVMGLLQKHNLYFGQVGLLQPRRQLSFGKGKDAFVVIGRRRFPMDRATYDQLRLGEGVIIESLRWTNFPVTIYRGFNR